MTAWVEVLHHLAIFTVRPWYLLSFTPVILIFQGGEDRAVREDGAGPPTGCPLSEEEGAEAGIPVLPGGGPPAAVRDGRAIQWLHQGAAQRDHPI